MKKEDSRITRKTYGLNSAQILELTLRTKNTLTPKLDSTPQLSDQIIAECCEENLANWIELVGFSLLNKKN